MPKMINALIKQVELLNNKTCKIVFESEYLAKNTYPGQFLNIKCSQTQTPLLRRPISICDVNRKTNLNTIVFQIKGTGTTMLTKLKPGDYLDILGPLGTRFDNVAQGINEPHDQGDANVTQCSNNSHDKGNYHVNEDNGDLTKCSNNSFNQDNNNEPTIEKNLLQKYSRILVIGGGIGVFPLIYLLKTSPAKFKGAILGFRNKDYVVMENEFKVNSNEYVVFTDDGSYAKKGIVVDGLLEYITKNKIQIVYACGPAPMLKSVAQVASEANVLCRISVEERMGCGIGACLVCACKVKSSPDKTDENFIYKHVCKDGPVFWSTDLIFS